MQRHSRFFRQVLKCALIVGFLWLAREESRAEDCSSEYWCSWNDGDYCITFPEGDCITYDAEHRFCCICEDNGDCSAEHSPLS
jgi:hypothetical protein